MTNILPNETTYSQLTPSGRALKLWWLYYPVDTTLAKYSSKDCFPSLYFQVANEEISKAQKNNAPNTPAYFCCLFCSKCTVLANLKKKKNQKRQNPTNYSHCLHWLVVFSPTPICSVSLSWKQEKKPATFSHSVPWELEQSRD